MKIGWFKESHRHSLAARGIKTNRYMARRTPVSVLYPYGRSPGDLPQRIDAERLRRLRDSEQTRPLWDQYRALEVQEREAKEKIEDLKGRVVPTYGPEDQPVPLGDGQFSPATTTPFADEALKAEEQNLARIIAQKQAILYGDPARLKEIQAMRDGYAKQEALKQFEDELEANRNLARSSLLSGERARGPPRDLVSERFERKAKETQESANPFFQSTKDRTTEAAKKSEFAGKLEMKELGFKIPEVEPGQPKDYFKERNKEVSASNVKSVRAPVEVSEQDIDQIAKAMAQTGFTEQQIQDQVAALRQGKTLFGRRKNLAEKQPVYRSWQ